MAERSPLALVIACVALTAGPAAAQTPDDPLAADEAVSKRCSWADVTLVERRTHPVEGATLAREFMDIRLGKGVFHVLTACGEDVGLVFSGVGEVDVRDAGPLRGHRLHNTFAELPGTIDIDRFVVWASDGAVQALLEQAGPPTEDAVPTAVRTTVTSRQSPFRPQSDNWISPPGRILYSPRPELGGALFDFHALSLKRKRRLESLEIRSQWLAYQWNPYGSVGVSEPGAWFQRRVGSATYEAYSGFPREATVADAGSPFAEELRTLPWNLRDAAIGIQVADVPGADRDLKRADFNVVLSLKAREPLPEAPVVPLVLSEGKQRTLGEQWAPIDLQGARLLPADGGEEVGIAADQVGDAIFVHIPDEHAPPPGGEVRIRLLYRGDVLEPSGLSSITPLGGWAWYPTLPVRDRHTAEIAVEAPKFWKIAATGARIEELTAGARKTVTSRTKRPVERAGVQLFDGREKTTPSPEEGLPSLRVYASPRGRALDAAVEEEVFTHLRALRDLFGSFPYDELEIVELGANGAIDVPGVIAVPRFDSPPDQVTTTRAGIGTLLTALVRQYVVADMGAMSLHDTWLIEGLTLLGECRALEKAGKAGRCRGLVRSMRDDWLDSLEGLGYTSDAALKDPIVGSVWLASQSGHARSASLRGPLVMDALRLLVGDPAVWATVKRVATSYRGQFLSTKSFVLHAQAASKQDLRMFFGWWVYATPQLPTIHLDYTLEKGPAGDDGPTWTLIGNVYVDTGSAAEPLPAVVPTILQLNVAGADPQLRKIVVTEQPREVRIEGLPGKVRKLALDPMQAFPGRTKVTKVD